jgi:hypothetical protein
MFLYTRMGSSDCINLFTQWRLTGPTAGRSRSQYNPTLPVNAAAWAIIGVENRAARFISARGLFSVPEMALSLSWDGLGKFCTKRS